MHDPTRVSDLVNITLPWVRPVTALFAAHDGIQDRESRIVRKPPRRQASHYSSDCHNPYNGSVVLEREEYYERNID